MTPGRVLARGNPVTVAGSFPRARLSVRTPRPRSGGGCPDRVVAFQELRRGIRRLWRALLRPDALLTLDEALEVLPGRPEAVRAWLVARVLPCGRVAGVDLYSWGEIVEAVAATRSSVKILDEPSQSRVPRVRTTRLASGETSAALPGDVLLGVEEVASLLRLTPKGIYSLVENRRIPFVRVSNRVRFRQRDVEAWLEKNRVPTVSRGRG